MNTKQYNNIMQTAQLFSVNYSQWSSSQKDQIQIFFLFNQFFAKFYQKRKFQQITKMCYFRKINPHQLLHLQNNNRPEAIILLSGKIIIKKQECREVGKSKHKKNKTSQLNEKKQYNQVRNIGKCTQYNQVFKLNSQCIIQPIGQTSAQIIFVPCSLYNKLIQIIQKERVQKIEVVLGRFFTQLRKKDLHLLSETNCLFKQFRMNNYIYRATDKPQEVFILLQGMIKLQKPGFSHKKMLQTIIINQQRLFGQKDILSQERQHNAICCTSHVQVLSIPKNAFLKYVGQFYIQKTQIQTQFTHHSNRQSLNFPKTQNLRINHKKLRYGKDSIDLSLSIQKSQIEKSRQYQLVKNSHMLLDISPKSKKKFSIKSSHQLNQLPEFKQLIKGRNRLYRSIKRNKNQFKLQDSLEKQFG